MASLLFYCDGDLLRMAIEVRVRRLIATAWVLATVGLLTGCQSLVPQARTEYSAGITGYNFTSEGVQSFYVQGMRGSNLPPYGGGGATSCCVQLPWQWTPDLKVKVDWTIGHYTRPWEQRKDMSIEQERACCWTQRTLSKVVPIQPYEAEGGRLQVLFLPNDEIEVWVSMWALGAPQHPSRRTYPTRPSQSD
ncbi:DUF3304 domain-containing protein [Pseudacidovorax intermedius]|uniref:DUF3304 domain-containing protein n=1 Tax=Pseudacidovorax intermedius TaxID=433924 RepID=UPI001FD3FBF0|nr:DUF3304 domain-containing protein [Pseudacidovorax intermedius]